MLTNAIEQLSRWPIVDIRQVSPVQAAYRSGRLLPEG